MFAKIKSLDYINDFPKVGFIFLENSGEKIMKFYLERIFHLSTGDNLKQSNIELDNKWIISSDFPFRSKSDYTPVDVSSIILLVRNPVDYVISKVLQDSLYLEEALEKIDVLIEEWKSFYKYWINAPVPVHIVRYEDLLHMKEDILKETCKFLLGLKVIENTKLDYLIKHACSEEVDSSFYAYDFQPEEGKNLLTSEGLDSIQNKFMVRLGKMMKKFNYELENDKNSDWMTNFNIDNMVKSIEFHEHLNIQNLSASYISIKIG